MFQLRRMEPHCEKLHCQRKSSNTILFEENALGVGKRVRVLGSTGVPSTHLNHHPVKSQTKISSKHIWIKKHKEVTKSTPIHFPRRKATSKNTTTTVHRRVWNRKVPGVVATISFSPLRVLASIDDAQTQVMLDSGAGVSLISKSFLQKLRERHRLFSDGLPKMVPYEGGEVRGVNGQSLPIHGIIHAQVELAGGRVSNFPLLVVDQIVEKLEVLAGNDLLSALQASINWKTQTVKAGNDGRVVHFDITPKKEHHTWKVAVSKMTTIEARTVTPVPVHIVGSEVITGYYPS